MLAGVALSPITLFQISVSQINVRSGGRLTVLPRAKESKC